jgi:hypothetical protein
MVILRPFGGILRPFGGILGGILRPFGGKKGILICLFTSCIIFLS